MYRPLPPETEAVATKIVDAAFQVHAVLGPGLLESVYETCLCYELQQRQLHYVRQMTVPIVYRSVTLDADLRIDLLVENEIIVEVKAVHEILPLHQAQVLTYLKLANHRLGLLINFCDPLFKDGLRRLVR